MVTKLDTTYSPRFMAYCLNNGMSVEMKCRKKKNPKNPKDKKVKKIFSDEPFADGDILLLKSCKQEPKMKKVGNDWETDYSTLVWWVYDWEIADL